MKTALITGANRGIGLAIAAGLNRLEEMKVLVGSRRAEDGDNAARTLGGNAVGVQLDLSTAKARQAPAQDHRGHAWPHRHSCE